MERMLTLQPATIVGATHNKNWYTDDELANIRIEAFQAGLSHNKDLFRNRLMANLQIAKEVAEKIYIRLFVDIQVKTWQIKLKPTWFNSFEAVIIIPQEDYFSPSSFHRIIDKADEVMDQYNNKQFNFSVLFMPYSRHINEDAFITDGFYITFGSINYGQIAACKA